MCWQRSLQLPAGYDKPAPAVPGSKVWPVLVAVAVIAVGGILASVVSWLAWPALRG